MLTFSTGLRELITDAAINALDEGRAAGCPDHDTREYFVRAAGIAFDVTTDPAVQAILDLRPDAQP